MKITNHKSYLNILLKSFPAFIFTLLFVGSFFTSYAQKSAGNDSLQFLLQHAPHDTNLVYQLTDAGSAYLAENQNKLALPYLQEARSISDEIGFKKGSLHALTMLGILYDNESRYKEAFACNNEAFAIAKQLGNWKGMADIISNTGITYSDQGYYDKALSCYLLSLRIREAIHDGPGTNTSVLLIANIYLLQNRFHDALRYYQQLLRNKKNHPTKYYLSIVYYNMGISHYHLNEMKQALRYFEVSLELSYITGDQVGVALSEAGIAGIYTSERKFEEALKLLYDAQAILNKLGYKKEVAETYNQLGLVYDSLGQYDNAFTYYIKEEAIGKEINSKVTMQYAYEGIANVYEKMQDFKNAYAYFKLYKALEDSMQREKMFNSIASIEGKYNIEKKEREIELIRRDQDVKQARYDQQIQFIYLAVTIGIVLLVVLFLLYNRYQIKRRSQIEKRYYKLERDALSAQMDPHFIFNSLGSIGGYIAENDKTKALEYLGVFSRLIRHNLEHSREQLVSVTDEVNMLKSYLFLQQLRYENRFTYEVITDELMNPSVALPPMFIQPFVENAILHGIIPKEGPGKISIRFYLKKEQELVCEVEDNGIGREASLNRKTTYESLHKSLSMTITKERMEIMNLLGKEKMSFHTEDLQDQDGQPMGTRVTLIFPVRYV